jgi:hypothetical protein
MVDGRVRFYEKDQAGAGCDVRVWNVWSPDGGSSFQAAHATS